MKYYISGSSGNIGKNLSNFLKRNDFEVVKIKRNAPLKTTKNLLFETNQPKNKDWLILCHGIISQTRHKNDKVMNLFTEANVNYSISLVRDFIKYGGKNIILISSLSVYNKAKTFTIIDKNTITSPSGLYGRSKLNCERELTKIIKKTPNTTLIMIRSPRVIVGFFTKLKFYIGKILQKPFIIIFRIGIVRPYILLDKLLDTIYVISQDYLNNKGIFFLVPDRVEHFGPKKTFKSRKDIEIFTKHFYPLKSIFVNTFVTKLKS